MSRPNFDAAQKRSSRLGSELYLRSWSVRREVESSSTSVGAFVMGAGNGKKTRNPGRRRHAFGAKNIGGLPCKRLPGPGVVARG